LWNADSFFMNQIISPSETEIAGNSMFAMSTLLIRYSTWNLERSEIFLFVSNWNPIKSISGTLKNEENFNPQKP
jgi:hypothetical protein